MSDLKIAIREYLDYLDAMFREGMRDGSMTVEEAKQDTADAQKWRELLAVLEAETVLYGGAE